MNEGRSKEQKAVLLIYLFVCFLALEAMTVSVFLLASIVYDSNFRAMAS